MVARAAGSAADGEPSADMEQILETALDPADVGDMVLDARRDPAMWRKFNAGLDGSAWYLMRMHQELVERLPESRSVERLGEAVNEILQSWLTAQHKD